MGTVELVLRQEGTFRRLYALKQPHAGLRDDEEFRRMFLDEGRLAGLLRHPNVVSVLDVGENHDGPFLVMDFVDGVSLHQIMRTCSAEAPLPTVLAITLATQVAEGLHAAHELVGEDGAPIGLVHRDVSPPNVLVGFDGIARLTDFGVAKALGRMTKTSTGVVKGKLGYMSPEQLRYEPLDRRADLFAFGVVLFEMLTGTRLYAPQDGDGPRRILNEPPPDAGLVRDGLPPELVELVFELLAKDPDDRPATAREVAVRLEDIRRDLVDAGEPETPVEELLAARFGAERDANAETRREAFARAERGELPVWGERTELAPPAPTKRSWWPALAAGGAALVGAVALGTWLGRSTIDEAPPTAPPTVAEAPAPVAEEPVVEAPVAESPSADEPVEPEPAAAPVEEPRPARRRRGRRRRAAATAPAEPASSAAAPSGPSPWPFAAGESE